MNNQFLDFVCPVCGIKDIELYAITTIGNFYRCKSTNTELEFKTEIRWIEADEDKKRLAKLSISKNKYGTN